jgi:hypothetical protein
METSTGMVVEAKLAPIAKADPVIPAQFTAQAAINLFSDFTTLVNSEAGAVCQVFQSFVVQARNATADEIKAATSGVVESTRITVDNKRTDTPTTALARKFQSMARAIWGAFRFGGLSLDEIQAFRNSQALYDVSRKCLADAQLDWRGITEADKAANKAKAEMRKAAQEVAEESGDDVLTLTPEQFSELRGKAAKKLAEKKAQAKLESMDKRASKLAKDLIDSYGIDDAEAVLKMALERLVTVAVGAAA